MGTSYTAAVTTPGQSTTTTLKRTVSDDIRHLWPGNPFMAIISSGMVSKSKDLVREPNLIGKRRVETPKYEAFTWTPHAVEFTVAAGGGGTTDVTVSSATGLRPKYGLVNTNNKTVCRVSGISTNDLTLQSVGGTTFSAAAGDKLLSLAPAYEENSSSPYILMKDPDNMYNFTRISRFPVAISRSAEGNPHYGGNRWKQYKQENVVEGLRKACNTLLFEERPSSTNESTTDATLGDAFRTCRGLWNWAQTTYDAGGNFTFEKFAQEMPLQFHSSVGHDMKKVFLCGTKVWSTILGWINEGLVIEQSNMGSYKKFGVESHVIVSAKGWIEVVVIDQFDQGSYSKCGLIFVPDRVDYVVLREYDFKAYNGIQANDVDGKMDEVKAEYSIAPWDAGYTIMTLTNLN